MYRKIYYPRALEYFLTVVEQGSFSRAAEVLHVTQPSLSQQIKNLEDTLKTRLLIRPGRTVRLTNAGEVYINFAKRARAELAAGARAVNDVQDLSRGTLKLGWTPITDHLTYELIDSFHESYPGIVISTWEMSQEYLEQAILEDTIDIGIAFTKPNMNDNNASKYVYRTMFTESLFLAVSSRHPLRKFTEDHTSCPPISLDMVLLNHDFALRQHIDDYCRMHSLDLHVVMETNSVSVILELAESGKLVTILPKSIIDNRDNLHCIQLEIELPKHAVSMIWHHHDYLNPGCAAFIEMASNWHPHTKKKRDGSAKTENMNIPVLPAHFFSTNAHNR